MKARILCILLIALLIAAVPASAEVTYEVFVRAFADSDGDGVGDLKGLMRKLDYLSELGVDSLWLMPVFPSPSYHGYDVTDYRSINPEYGTMEDLEALLADAHSRGMAVILDLPINHTSIDHPWFRERPEFYRWADERANLDLRVWGEKVWKPYGDTWYYAIFWDGMPDLDYENPDVRDEMIDIALYWLDMGVDGFRLDAASHIYGMGEWSARQEIERSASWWVEFQIACVAKNPNCYLLGEAWESLDKRAALLAGLDAAVNFDVGGAIIALLRTGGSGKGYVRNLALTYAAYAEVRPGIPDAPFLTNHDQNRVYAALGAKPERAKMAANMLLTLPGNPILYYGEEIGMMGAKPDEEIRTPMLWGGGDRSETRWHPSIYNTRTLTVAEQDADPDSLLNHYRRLLAFRRAHPALTGGEFDAADVGNDIVAAYALSTPEERALIIHNATAVQQETAEGVIPACTSLIVVDGERWTFP